MNPISDVLDLFLYNSDYKQALQLSIYAYSMLSSNQYLDKNLQCGIWSLSEVNSGVQSLKIFSEDSLNRENLEVCMNSIKNIIKEILNPEIPFEQKI